MRNNKSVLIIAYHWPPDASVGAVRSVKLAQQFIGEGWQPVVLTVKERYYEHLDTRVRNEAQQALTLRTQCLPSLRAIYLAIKASISWILRRESPHDSVTLTGTTGTEAAAESVMATAKRIVLSLLHTPDDRLGWLPFAVVRGFVAIKAYDIKCVMSIGPPFTTHLIGLMLRKICRVPWIADFRDPWSWNEQKPWHVNSALSQRIDNWLEKKVIDNADKVVCVTSAMTERYRKMYLTNPEDKWITITNGFDTDEFEKLEKVEQFQVFTITYVGGFEYGRSPRTLLCAIGELLRERIFERQKLAVRLIGRCRYAEGCSVQHMISDQGLDSIVELIDFMPRTDALKEMLRSHVLVLLASNQPFQVPGKAYEYIAAQRPILALCEEGATADLINQTRSGVVVSPTDVAGIKEPLADWYKKYTAQAKLSWDRCPEGSTSDYSWTVLGDKYVSVLDMLATTPNL